ncbi:hypothetical protein SAMN05660766_0461 [Curtobacterium sp. 314Chir4.1]|nr:hypothetical protein SAMN05660766_0461 [Curtobacterium sp. 314Chir4.1]
MQFRKKFEKRLARGMPVWIVFTGSNHHVSTRPRGGLTMMITATTPFRGIRTFGGTPIRVR